MGLLLKWAYQTAKPDGSVILEELRLGQPADGVLTIKSKGEV